MTTLLEKYNSEIKPQLVKELGIKSPMAIPVIEKITVNIGIGEESKDKNQIEAIKKELTGITGQAPVIKSAKKSIAGFGIREGMPVGLTVTLRRGKMYSFLYKLNSIVLPRIRDFRGIPTKSFDKMGNYSLGLAEYSVFPEVDLSKVSKLKGMQITLTIKNSDPERSKLLLTLLGVPFEKPAQEKK